MFSTSLQQHVSIEQNEKLLTKAQLLTAHSGQQMLAGNISELNINRN